MLAAARRTAVKAGAITILAAAIAGIPAWLITAIGWPLPQSLPTAGSLAATLNGTVTDQMIVNLIAVGIWLAWAAFTHAIVTEALAMSSGRDRQRPARNPLRGVATVLIGAAFMGTVMSATATAAGTTATDAAGAPAPGPPMRPAAVTVSEQPASMPATVRIGAQTYTYTVVRGDYLSKIAQQWLGDDRRWPEICNLNMHKHFASVGGTLTDCDLIFPGWELTLPQDATPPAGAVPLPAAEPAAPATPPVPETPPPSKPTPVTPSSAPSAQALVPAAAPSAVPSATVNPQPVQSPAETAAAESSQQTPAPEHTSAADSGVSLPGNTWLPWTFAIAITAAASAVWIQRRRRFSGDLDEEPITSLPAVVSELRREVRANPAISMPGDDAAKAAAVPAMTSLPPGGIGLTGDGAHHAARAAIAETLAAGGPLYPPARGEVVIDASTLATLIGSDAIALGPWERLHIADNADHALAIVEEQLLHRARLLDEYELSDVATLAAQEPSEEPLPPILLVAESPPKASHRAKTTLALGSRMGVSALLLGDWPHGPTLSVSEQGHTALAAGDPVDGLPTRMAVLGPDAAIAILATLREAQTGEPTPTTVATAISPITLLLAKAAPPDTTNRQTPGEPSAVSGPGTADGQPAIARAAQPNKAVLKVLGTPQILNTASSAYHLRGKALELGVYLSCYRDGKTVPELVDVLEAEGRASQADKRVHTQISNLRRGLAEYSGIEAKYVIKDGDRGYKLDPTAVDVDLWQLQALLTEARTAVADARRDLLRQACDLYAPLADGAAYDWLAPHAEAVRRIGLHAHLALADDLLAQNLHAAIAVLDAAIGIDPYSETVYVQAMRAHHAAGDGDGIRHLMNALKRALTDVDAEPTEETIELARQLRVSLEKK